jgi:hypothetical protein
MVFILNESVPPFDEAGRIDKKATDALADQFMDGNSEDSCRRGICIQAIAIAIDDQDPIEYILED